MCLLIDPTKHNFDCLNYYEPKITRSPKKVYKILYITPNCNNTYYTPYQCVPVNFRDRKAVLKAPTMIDYYINSWSIVTINVGIHAFYDKDIALARLALSQHRDYAVFEAIIPPSTKYFIGIEGDIVCEKLIIKNKIISR